MDAVKQWALTVVIAAAAGAVVLMLAPDGSMNKSLKTAVSLFLTAAMVLPLAGGLDMDFTDMISETDSGQPELDSAISDQMREVLSSEIEKLLDENGIKCEEINIDMNIESNEISVRSIHIVVRNGGNTDKVKKRIEAETGATVTIEVRR